MKIKFSIFFFIVSLSIAQDFTEKYNIELQRIEYYDLSGNLLGYSKENTKYNRLEFYDSAGVIVHSYPQDAMLFLKLSFDKDVSKRGIKRWNYLKNRYDVYDSLGVVKGFYQYDVLGRRWVYYNDFN